MKLTNTIQALKKYLGKSKFEFWTDIEPGDLIKISMVLASPGRKRDGIYATEIRFRNLSRAGQMYCSLTQAENYLKQLEYKEYENTENND